MAEHSERERVRPSIQQLQVDHQRKIDRSPEILQSEAEHHYHGAWSASERLRGELSEEERERLRYDLDHNLQMIKEWGLMNHMVTGDRAKYGRPFTPGMMGAVNDLVNEWWKKHAKDYSG